jgi:HEAT repeat protein
MAELGIQAGIGFVPFGGMGWRAYKTLHKDDGSPVRAAAAKVLSKDPDPNTTEALTDAAGDRSWGVRVAALEALAERGDASALPTVEMYMSDERDSVRYTAAAAVLRLSAVKEGHTSRKRGKESVPQP